MVLYLDTSALLKRYVAEPESKNVLAKIDEARAIATALITRAEVAAALSRARRETRIDVEEAQRAEQEFIEDWADFGRVPVTEELVGRREREAFWTPTPFPSQYLGAGQPGHRPRIESTPTGRCGQLSQFVRRVSVTTSYT